jgi:hypothetical protein
MEREDIETQIKNLLQNSNKFSQSTISNYVNNIKKLKKILGTDTNNIGELLRDEEAVFDAVEKNMRALSSKKLMLTILKKLSEILELPNRDTYLKMMNSTTDSLNEVIRNNRIPEDRIDRWTSWKEIENLFERIEEPESLGDIQDKLIIGLYTKIPYTFRNDFVEMKTTEDYEKEENKENNNYIEFNGKKIRLLINNYKTSKKYGQIIVPIGHQGLAEILALWKKYLNPEYLLLDYNGFKKPLSKSSFSKRVVKIFEKYTGKKINVQILRQIKESDNIYGNKSYDKLNLNEKIKMSKKLLHSFEMSHQYAKKS